MERLSFLVDGELYAVDATLVERVVRNIPLTPIPAVPCAVVGIANLKGKVVTLLSLSEMLGRPKGPGAVYAVIFKPTSKGNDQMGLMVDRPDELILVDDEDILPPDSPENREETLIISGLAPVADRHCKIVDVGYIASHFRDQATLQGQSS